MLLLPSDSLILLSLKQMRKFPIGNESFHGHSWLALVIRHLVFDCPKEPLQRVFAFERISYRCLFPCLQRLLADARVFFLGRRSSPSGCQSAFASRPAFPKARRFGPLACPNPCNTCFLHPLRKAKKSTSRKFALRCFFATSALG